MTSIDLSCGDASRWKGTAGLVFTHPYAELPEQLRSAPMIINQFPSRQGQVEAWCGTKLTMVGDWGRENSRNRVWHGNMSCFPPISLAGLVEDEDEPDHGWFPLELPLRLLDVYAGTGITVWDGFMGRGTVGRACKMLGLNFIGIDIKPDRMEMAREYIGAA